MSEETLHRIRPVTVHAVVPASPDAVFDYIADTRNDPEWCPNVDAVSQVAGKGVDVGARFAFDQTVEVRGRKMQSTVEVEVIHIDAHTITWRAEDRFQVREVTVIVEPHPDGSKVTQRTEPNFKRKPGLMVVLLYPVMARKTFRDQFRRLANHFQPT